MCRFCTQHGDGKKWYLEAANYAYDLESDLRRRGYVIDFVQDFDTSMKASVRNLELLAASPEPIRMAGQALVSKRMQGIHFGQPLPIEDCAKIFDMATSITRLPCVCRGFSQKPDEGYCLAVTTTPSADEAINEAFEGYSRGPDTLGLERQTKRRAMKLLRRSEEQGMMHSVWTFITPFIGAICNCSLESGCMAMKLTLDYGVKLMWKGENLAGVDQEACEGCGECAAVCPFGAVETGGLGSSSARVDPAKCWGCGTCRGACGVSAISLSPRAGVPEAADVW